MKGNLLTAKEIEQFCQYLHEVEKSENTQKKYIRDVITQRKKRKWV